MATRPTCFSLALSALISLHCQQNSPLYNDDDYNPANVDAFLQTVLVEANHRVLDGVNGPPLRALLLSMRAALGGSFCGTFLMWLGTAVSSVDALLDLMGTCRQALPLSGEATAAAPHVSATSTNGLYLRAVCLGFDELSFDAVGLLWTEFSRQVQEAATLLELSLGKAEEVATVSNTTAVVSSDWATALPSWPLSSTQIEDALQQEVRGLAAMHRSHAHASERHAQIEAILEQNPELPSGHFLHFWYYLQAGERQGAIDALHRYLDSVLVQRQSDEDVRDDRGKGDSSGATGNWNNDESGYMILQFAAILAAAVWAESGDPALSVAATQEAVRVAQQSQDASCVAFALGWLGIHSDANSKGSAQKLLRRCTERAAQGNLRSLNAGASLILALENADRPTAAWRHWLRALAGDGTATEVSSGQDRGTDMNSLGSGGEALDILARQRLVATCIWDVFGYLGMSSVASQLVLEFHGDHILSQEIATAVQNIARCSLHGFSPYQITNDLHKALQKQLEGDLPPSMDNKQCIYASALQILKDYEVVLNRSTQGIFRLEMLLLLHEWSVRRGELSLAEEIVRALQCFLCPRVPNYDEVRIDVVMQQCLLLSRQERWDKAKTLIRNLIEQCKSEGRKLRYARSLLLLATVHFESSPEQFSGALPSLFECLTVTRQSHMNGVHACGLILLGRIQLQMGNIKRALAVLRAALLPVLQHEHVFVQGEAYLTMAKCHLQLAQETAPSFRDYLQYGIKELQLAIKAFTRCQDRVRLEESYRLLAFCYDTLPGKVEARNEAARLYIRLSRQRVVANGPDAESLLKHLDNKDAFRKLIARPVLVL